MSQAKKITFSIVIPLYNKEKEIERAIESVLSQTRQEFELIIVDDGSTDNSASIVRQYDDSRKKLIQQTNAGVSAARNKGIENSSNDYIAFLDADDTWKENFLDIIHNLACQYPDAGAYATAFELVNLNGEKKISHFSSIPPSPWEGLLPSYFRAAIEGEPVSTSAVVVPKSVLLDVGNFPTTTSMGEDKDVWERIALKYQIAYSNRIGATYFLNSSNRISTTYFKNISKSHGAFHYGIEQRRPFFSTAQEAIAQDEISLDILPDLVEYLEKYKLISAEIYIKFAGKPGAARNILTNTYPRSKQLQRKKYFLYVMSLMPPSIVRFALNIKNKFR